VTPEERTPPVGNSKHWQAASAPLRAFLKEPRDWTAIGGWCRGHGMSEDVARNCIAWLELTKLAWLTTDGSGSALWVSR
jgi:hypothetical protein